MLSIQDALRIAFVSVQSDVGLGIFLLVLLAGLLYYREQFHKVRFPPGPPMKLAIGNIFDIPSQGAWTKLTECQKQYGDLVFFRGLGNNVLVLNSMALINDFFEKRSPNYSHRPQFTFAGELMGVDRTLPLLSYGDEWRAQRKLAHTALSQKAIQKYHVIQEDLAASLAGMFLDAPEDFFHHVRLIAGRIVLSVTYGVTTDEREEKFIVEAEAGMQYVHKVTVPGAVLCDLLPFLKHAPSWVPFKQEAKRRRGNIDRMAAETYEYAKHSIETAGPSLVRELLDAGFGSSALLEERIMWTAGAMYAAGSETTYTTILTGIMAMALHPDKQRKAQKEIDNVIGSGRLPVIQDRDSLPYVNAVIKEVMRWHPALPLGIARRSAEADVYEGYLIPKSTILIPNIWAIAHAPNEKYDPQAFIPERFLDETQNIPDPATWAFGFARRMCPGKALGENSVFILFATILAMFEITPPEKDKIVPKFTLGLASCPEPFPCIIKPRSDAQAALVKERGAQRSF
ncbi:cytochrome P450 [Amylocystis lapponica]|nr:cytochrome P450 [Amylocystis lapponica]